MRIELLSITPDAERLIEAAGRTAYLSFDKKGEGTDKKFIRMLLKNGHYSVLEHVYATFRITGVSRAMTHQLVRHRLCAFTQQSQRYVNERLFRYIEPESIRNDKRAHELFHAFMEDSKKTYARLQELGIKNEDARFVLPNAVESQLVVSANIREWRHVIDLRARPSSQWEIRAAAIEILRLLKKHIPSAFEDIVIDEGGKTAARAEDF
jgi:thymidylate synthase (FAD)